jgi:MFS family permease
VPLVGLLALAIGVATAFSIPSGPLLLPHTMCRAAIAGEREQQPGQQRTGQHRHLAHAHEVADARLHGGAALGLVMGMFSAGTLGGMILTGVAGKLRLGNLGTTLLTIDMAVAALLMPLGHVRELWQAAAAFAVFGLLGGFIQVAVLTWIQPRVPRAMLGRAMSIFMFIIMGVAALSAGVVGWAMQSTSLEQLFAGVGAILAAVAALAWAFTPMRAIADVKPGEQV